MKNLKTYSFLFAGLSALLFSACTPESSDLDLAPAPEASFSIEPATQNNRYVVTNTTTGAFGSYWNVGDGYSKGEAQQTLFLPDVGTYDISLVAVTAGGVDTAAVQQIVVDTPDPVAGNLVAGSKMGEDALDHWTVFTISGGVNIDLTDGKMVASGGGWGHAGLYQAIDVEAGKTYKFGASVAGNGATEVWLETFFGSFAPSDGNDYSDGGNKIGLNTWNGCGNAPFSGNLAQIGCSGDLVGQNGEITFDQSGTVYLVMKIGGADLGVGGISIDNVELRGTE
ncbi:hypothetical protein [Roseivirga pacifica]|uniref:hypothetical protein n=1 Tax=Roseivirga pacifica TaxID=1267423 RepID=UPI00227A2524|nr:hypothetical protein [Roseivirga pacifica]